MSYSSKEDTKKHQLTVEILIKKMRLELQDRANSHDKSKLEEPELSIFDEYTPKLKRTTYGSDEYKQYLKEMKIALDHHYANNRHHPEHFKKYVCNGCFKEFKELPERCDNCGYTQMQEESDISQMNLIDLIEMFCDWLAATKRHDDGDIRRSVEINQDRFKYSDDIKSILMNTCDLFE